MKYNVEYKASVFHDLKKLDKKVAKRILNKTEKILSQNPGKGIPLKGQFEGLFKIRIGDYRVVYVKKRDAVLILRIGHRKKVYQ